MTYGYLFRLMYDLFWGFLVSLSFCALTAATVWLSTPNEFPKYVIAFVASFNCLISGGLIIGTSIFVVFTQKSIPSLIERSFDKEVLAKTKFALEKEKYLHPRRSATFSTNFIGMGFPIFFLAEFPVSGISTIYLIFFSCMEYGLMVYVGRKLYYIAKMLNALLNVTVTRETFRKTGLNNIISYVNILSTLTVMFVYINVKSYVDGPFVYGSIFGVAAKTFLLLPAIVMTPVLVIFNFYPRMVLRQLYSQSIDGEVARLVSNLRDDHLTEFEKKSYAIEYDKLERDELRNLLQLSLSDLPLGVTIVLMIIGLMIKA